MANVLFLIEHLNGGGAERVVSEISSELEQYHNVTLAIFEDRGTSYRHCENLLCLNIPGTSKLILKPINLIKRIIAVRRIKKKNNIDISISFISNANLVNVLSGGKNNICSIRTVLSSIVKSKSKRYIERKLLLKADCIITLSNYVKQDLIDNFFIPKLNIQTIYNPIFRHNHSLKKQINKTSNKNTNNINFITAGRMVTAKGQWHLIKSFYAFQQLYGGRLTILGDGPLRSKLENLVSFLGLNESVDFKGFVDDPYSEYVKSDVFVLTSLWEGFGNVIVEAMDCSIPVICAECPGGPKEILDPDNTCSGDHLAEFGLLTDAFPQKEDIVLSKVLTEEENALFKTMSLMMNENIRDKYSQKSFIRAQAFTIDKIVSEWNDLIIQKCN